MSSRRDVRLARARRLGIEGFGPERAIYEAVFVATGIHRERDGASALVSRTETAASPPLGRRSSASSTVRRSDRAASMDSMSELLSPPFGMKEGPIPLSDPAALQARSEDVLVYEDGTFQPRLGPEHIERLMKTPERFAVKRLALDGARAGCFDGVRELLSSPDLPEARNADCPLCRSAADPLRARPSRVHATDERISAEAQGGPRGAVCDPGARRALVFGASACGRLPAARR